MTDEEIKELRLKLGGTNDENETRMPGYPFGCGLFESGLGEAIQKAMAVFDPGNFSKKFKSNFSKKLNARGLVLIEDAWKNMNAKGFAGMMPSVRVANAISYTAKEAGIFLKKLYEAELIKSVVDAGLVGSEEELFEESDA